MTGTRLIRVVLPRHEVKSLASVIDKIRRQRQKQDTRKPPYDFQMIEDLIGIKILCPYESSAKEVIRWMWTQAEKFHVLPRSLEKALVRRTAGYRGWHLVATPVAGREPRWVGVRCEIQVKTMLQEAWDAQTHDITYKREETIEPALFRAMRKQSEKLHKLDKGAESIRRHIQKVEEIEQRMKDAAAAVFYWKGLDMLAEMEKEFSFNASRSSVLKCECLSPPNVSAVNRAVAMYFRRGRLLDRDNGGFLTGNLCNLSALLAICQQDPGQESMALWLADELVHRAPADPRAEDIKAGVLWGLDRLEEAVACGREALNKIPKGYDDFRRDLIQQNHCYWVAELARAGKDVEGSLQGEILKTADKLLTQNQQAAGFLDTVGFVKICLGRTPDEVRLGLRLVRKAYRLATRPNVPTRTKIDKKLASPFRRRHEAIAKRRLKELKRAIS